MDYDQALRVWLTREFLAAPDRLMRYLLELGHISAHVRGLG